MCARAVAQVYYVAGVNFLRHTYSQSLILMPRKPLTGPQGGLTDAK